MPGKVGAVASTRVYVSLPLRGRAGPTGRDILRGAELAFERADRADTELVALDASGEERDERATANAHRAAADPRAVAYLGDFHSSQVMCTAPLLSQAGLLQVAPAATFTGLRGSTLVRLTPDDRMLARAIAAWAAGVGVRRLLVVHDDDDGYGTPVGKMCVEAARERGLDVGSRTVWGHGEPMADDVRDRDAVLYAGVAGSGSVGLWNGLHATDPDMWLLGTDGVAAPWLAHEVSTGAAERTRFFSGRRAPWGFYGFEAAALILAAAADGDRAGTARAALMPRDRDSVIGRYSVDEHGLTTCADCGRLAIIDGELVWDRARNGK